MGHGHSHRAGHDDVEVGAVPRTALLSLLAAALVVTVIAAVTVRGPVPATSTTV